MGTDHRGRPVNGPNRTYPRVETMLTREIARFTNTDATHPVVHAAASGYLDAYRSSTNRIAGMMIDKAFKNRHM